MWRSCSAPGCGVAVWVMAMAGGALADDPASPTPAVAPSAAAAPASAAAAPASASVAPASAAVAPASAAAAPASAAAPQATAAPAPERASEDNDDQPDPGRKSRKRHSSRGTWAPPPAYREGTAQRPPVAPVELSESFDSQLAAPGLAIAGGIITAVGSVCLLMGISGLDEKSSSGNVELKPVLLTAIGGSVTLVGVTLGIVGLSASSPVIPPEYEMLARQPSDDVRGFALYGAF